MQATVSYDELVERFERLEKEVIELRLENARLRKENAKQAARIKELEAQLSRVQGIAFGRKSEAAPRTSPSSSTPKRPERRSYDHLPLETVRIEVPHSERTCKSCGKPYRSMEDAIDSPTLEIEVKAHRRVVRREVLAKACSCKEGSKFLKAPHPGKIVPKGSIGTSIWIHLLMAKYAWHVPLERELSFLSSEGLDMAQPTVIDGFRHIEGLLRPLYEELCKVNRQEAWWNSDETTWHRIGDQRHWLWVFLGRKSCVYKVAEGRSAQVLEEHLGDVEGILHCDRYTAYKKYAKDKGIDLAYCWAHVRRDFVRLSKLAEHREWSLGILKEIGEIYHHAGKRYTAEGDRAFRDQVYGFLERRRSEGALATGERRKVLESLDEHYQGLTTVCVDPGVSLDNNAAERALRGPVVGRKNYWGSKSAWSGQLSATMFSVIETAEMNGLNPKQWLKGYLEACASNKGKAPFDLLPWLPLQTS